MESKLIFEKDIDYYICTAQIGDLDGINIGANYGDIIYSVDKNDLRHILATNGGNERFNYSKTRKVYMYLKHYDLPATFGFVINVGGVRRWNKLFTKYFRKMSDGEKTGMTFGI